ncbi:MAG: ACP phosphodiesterase [Fibrobacterales bacterium]
MNYLAHSLLSPPIPGVLLGNVCGDFVKGSINPGVSDDLWSGIQLHRFIDGYTDNHPIFLQSRARLSATRRRFAGIIIDVAYDYFLSQHWDRFSTVKRFTHIDSVYTALVHHETLLPSQFIEVRDRIIRYDWLRGYHSLDGIAQTLESISRRFAKRTGRENPLTGSIEEIILYSTELEEDFLTFFPQLQNEVAQWITENVTKR